MANNLLTENHHSTASSNEVIFSINGSRKFCDPDRNGAFAMKPPYCTASVVADLCFCDNRKFIDHNSSPTETAACN